MEVMVQGLGLGLGVGLGLGFMLQGAGCSLTANLELRDPVDGGNLASP